MWCFVIIWSRYSTVEVIAVAASSGEVTQYGTLFEGGGLFGKRQAIIFQAFNLTEIPRA